jgi:hypothetical protein
MMKKLMMLFLISLFTAGCDGQKTTSNKKDLAVADTTQPDIGITVNKTYDDAGNLVRYDSTYTYFYRSPGGASLSVSGDSLFRRFTDPLRFDFRSNFKNRWDSIFFDDSLFRYDFHNSDYFSRRFELNRKRLEMMMHEMDSLKTDWMKRNYPQGEWKSEEGLGH